MVFLVNKGSMLWPCSYLMCVFSRAGLQSLVKYSSPAPVISEATAKINTVSQETDG